jgi:hypothetical protein
MLRHVVKVKMSSNFVIFMLKYPNIEITINISKHLGVFYHDLEIHMWSDNTVHEVIAVKVLHTSLLNITVVAFKEMPWEAMHRCTLQNNFGTGFVEWPSKLPSY